MAASSRLPVVVILGATGSGKSKLALEIGRFFNGEIVGADSMQIYKGLDIITNKVTAEEQRICPHHMIDYLSPLQEHNTIVEYRNAALPIIDRLLQDGKLPIVCGGTTYYIESLLWNYLINKQDISKLQAGNASNSISQTGKAAISELQTGNAAASKLQIGNTAASKSQTENAEISRQTKLLSPENPIDWDKRLCNLKIKDKDSGDDGNKFDEISNRIIDVNRENVTTERNQTDLQKFDQEQTLNQEINKHFNDSESDSDDSLTGEGKKTSDSDSDSDGENLYQRLLEIDPVTARRIHPHDHRKLKRAVEVYEQHGVTMSEIHKAQKSGEPDFAKSGPLRYPHTCVFWIQSDQKVLENRINKRVGKMLEAGLLQELLDFHQQYNIMRIKQNREIDYTLGIFQSIGFKEFHSYLILSPSERETEEGKQLLQQGIENLKMVTRQYARKQIRTIKARFLNRPGTNVPPVYGLDATDVTKWEENVYKPAVSILTDILEGRQPSIAPLPYKDEVDNVPVYHVCEACGGKVFVMQSHLEAHMNSRKHKKRVQKLKKLNQSKFEDGTKSDDKQKVSENTNLTEKQDQVIDSTQSTTTDVGPYEGRIEEVVSVVNPQETSESKIS